VAELENRGEGYFRALYGESVDDLQGLPDSMYPDTSKHSTLLERTVPILKVFLGWFVSTLAYGSIIGYSEILTQQETLYVLISSLIAVDTPPDGLPSGECTSRGRVTRTASRNQADSHMRLSERGGEMEE